jgi:hypothetical protein
MRKSKRPPPVLCWMGVGQSGRGAAQPAANRLTRSTLVGEGDLRFAMFQLPVCMDQSDA